MSKVDSTDDDVGQTWEMTPLDLMQRDLGALGPAAAVVLALPVVALLVLAAGRRLAIIPLVLSALLGAGWYLYYDRNVANPGIAGAWAAIAVVLGGWAFLLVALVWRTESRPVRER